jgi:hypothetical protein
MKKSLAQYTFLSLLVFAFYGCKQQAEKPKPVSSIEQRLASDTLWLRNNASRLDLEETVMIDGKSESKDQDVKGILNVLKAVIETEPGRIMTNTSYLKQTNRIEKAGGGTEIESYLLKKGEDQPFKRLTIIKTISGEWNMLELYKSENNKLFTSSQFYKITYDKNQLSGLSFESKEKTAVSAAHHFEIAATVGQRD